MNLQEGISVNDLSSVKKLLANVAQDSNSKTVEYVDIRLEAGEGIGSVSEDGNPKATSQDWGLSLGIRVIANKGIAAAGYLGKQLGFNDFKNLEKVLKDGIATAATRALDNSKAKTAFVKKYKHLGKTIVPTKLAAVAIVTDTFEAEYEQDPRQITTKEITEYTCHAASLAKKHHQNVARVELIVNSGISRQIFASSQGSLIDQSHCSTGSTIFILAQDGTDKMPADLYHHTGNQLGFEALTQGKNAHHLTLEQFATEIAQETVLLSKAKPAPAQDKEVTVVIDPDLVALFAHEIIGHPSELDRCMKMETGYAGRSWFFQDLEHTMVGKQIGSPLLNAFSDPTLKGAYGYYKYDDEGTPAKRVYHLKKGVYTDFMNSRQTAEIAGKTPNGHYKANDASVIPLIRMSVSAIEGGKDNPKKIIADVKNGYYCVGHRIPSISESRENFQIAPRLIYEIKNGQLGQVYRDGRVTADSKNFFMSIDAVGSDFTIFPIPNCGKGQPMQAKQVGNGGPTVRARAKIARG